MAIFGFSVLTVVTVLTYGNAPPIPRRVVDTSGAALFSGEEIERGQEVFLRHALMEHGTLWGHGAYLGPDYTAEHLHREVEIARDVVAAERFGSAYAALPDGERGQVADVVRRELKVNRYDPASGTLTFSPGEVAATRALEAYWGGGTSRGLGPPPGSHRRASETRRRSGS